MLHFLKKQLAKYKQARQGVLEYGSEVKTFEIDGIGKVEFAQWLHPSEKPVISIPSLLFNLFITLRLFSFDG